MRFVRFIRVSEVNKYCPFLLIIIAPIILINLKTQTLVLYIFKQPKKVDNIIIRELNNQKKDYNF